MAAFKLHLTITGIQEAMAANQKAIAALKPQGALGRAIQSALIAAHRYAATITHVDTGSLRASHRMTMNGTRGLIFIDSSFVNPRSRSRPVEYGFIEHRRGFPHNFYERTVNERGDAIAQAAMDEVLRGLP